MDDRDGPGRSLGIIGGGALVLFGGWFLLRSLDVIPARLFDIWGRAALPSAIIAIGILLVLAASQGRLSVRGPLPGSRLYKSRNDVWVEGVIGGLGAYLGVDPVLLRLAFIGLMLVNAWGLVVAYIVMAVLVPREPA
jgi:phage shock protein C